jgi:hypothetical protein
MKRRASIIAGIACLTVLGFGVDGRAATFNISNGDVAGLKSAITIANTNGADDTINLTANGSYVLTTLEVVDLGLPSIESDNNHALTINGAGSTIRRSTAGGTPNFRIFSVSVGANLTLDRLTLSNGHLTSGSGGCIASSGSLTLSKCIVINNSISGGTESSSAFGGAIATFAGSTLMVTDSDISFNTASAVQAGRGGGISSAGTLSIIRSTLSGNTVTSAGIGSGGGVRVRGPSTIINSTISGNSATGPGNGGGIQHQPLSMSDTLLLVNCTVAENGTDGSGEGGGIYSFSSVGNETLLVRNTIIATNTSNSGPDVLAGGVSSQGHNLVGKTDGSSGWNVTDLTGTIATPLAPMLASLSDNGGVGFTHRLLNSSPAINTGDDGVLGPPHSLTTDQRLAPRRIGMTVDIGAFEFDVAQSALVVNTVDEHDDGLCGIGDCTLQEALNLANSNPDASTITFQPDLTGVLTNQDFGNGLVISAPVTIDGPGARQLTVSGGLTARIFSVQAGPTVISGLTLADGRPGADGGAILNAVNLTLNNCFLTNNVVPGSGGAILNGGALAINGCTFTANVANTGTGGAIHNVSDAFSHGTATVINSTFYNNLAFRGGALSHLASNSFPATSLLRNCTVSGNAARFNGTNQGGGVINLGTSGSILRLENTIVAGNFSDDVDPDVSGILTSGGYNIIGLIGGATGLTNGVNHDQVGSGAFPVNPQLAALTNNGGPTDTRALLSNSPAINMGNDTNAPTRDQRYYTRSGVSDIGAFESGAALAPLSAASRKMHGSSAFDINLPLTGSAGIECRSGGATNDHLMVVTFSTPVTVTSAQITAGTGTAFQLDNDTHGRLTVHLTGVTNAQSIVTTLSGVNDGINMANVAITMGALLGDTTGNGTVNATDVSQTKLRSGQPVDATNFRSDVSVSNSINATDVSTVKLRSGTALP